MFDITKLFKKKNPALFTDILAEKGNTFIAGFRGFSAKYPENTMIGFRAAVDAGADILHLDIRRTADNRLVVIHDDTADRTTNGSGAVCRMSFADIRKLDAGSYKDPRFKDAAVPPLEDVCELLLAYPELMAIINISDADTVTVDLAVEMLSLYGITERCILACCDGKIIGYIHERYNLRTQGFSAASMVNFEEGKKGSYSRMFAAGVYMNELDPKCTYELERFGVPTWCYLPKDEKELYLAGICGANLLVCEDVELAVKLLRKQNEKATD